VQHQPPQVPRDRRLLGAPAQPPQRERRRDAQVEAGRDHREARTVEQPAQRRHPVTAGRADQRQQDADRRRRRQHLCDLVDRHRLAGRQPRHRPRRRLLAVAARQRVADRRDGDAVRFPDKGLDARPREHHPTSGHDASAASSARGW
jgi:hypothetical protein